MSITATNKTALCLIPPENIWEQIQSIRSVHDKAYPRWMPHINLIYPFVPESEFSNIKFQLEKAINKKIPIEIEFDQTSIHYFQQKGNECTFHLRPKETKYIIELQKIIQNVLSNYNIKNSRQFEAHLTLGQTIKSRISDMLIEMKAKWKPIKFTIDRICMISRENDPNDLFSIKNDIILSDSVEENTNNNNNDDEKSPVQIETPSIKKISKISSLKYYLCIIPPSEFSTRLLHLFEDTSLSPLKPFRIILAEYDDKNFLESNLRSQIESIGKFTIDFGARSICFNYSTSRLFLKPTNIELIEKFNFNKNNNFDGTLTLGELDKKDLTGVGNRFTDNWTFGINEFEVDRIYVIDSNERFQHIFPLRSQCFS